MKTNKTKSPTQRKEELHIEVEALVREWNQAYLDESGSKIADITVKLDKQTTELKKACKVAAFQKLKESEDAMFGAVKEPLYDTYRVKEEKNKDTGVITKTLVEDKKPIKLLELDKYCDGIGEDPKWKHMAEKLHYALIVKAATEDLGLPPERIVKIKECYAMEEIVRQTQLPGKNPVSKTSLRATMQAVVNAMLGDEHKTKSGKDILVTNHDINYMYTGYAKQNNTVTNLVTVASKADFIRSMLYICHNRYEELRYDINCRDVKEKK